MQVPRCFDQLRFAVSFGMEHFKASNFALAIRGPLHFHIKCGLSLSISEKKGTGVLIEATAPQINLGRTSCLRKKAGFSNP